MFVTGQQHILQQQKDQFPAARGNFPSLLYAAFSRFTWRCANLGSMLRAEVRLSPT